MSLRLTLPTDIVLNPHKQAAALARYHVNRRLRVADIAAAGFDFPTQTLGTTPDGMVTVYYDPSLGSPGAELANQVFLSCAKTYADCQAFFNTAGQPVNVIIAAVNGRTDGSGGAYHYGCNFSAGSDLYCDAALGNPDLTMGLVVAELTESFMGAQSSGWDCGGSNGEALSRFLAELLSGGPTGALAAYATGPTWDQDGRPNWIDASEPTDQDPDSTGCGIVYLYWMMSKGFSASQITQAGCPDGTLASNYAALVGDAATVWSDFSGALAGLAGNITSDDPWGAAQAAAQRPGAPAHHIVIDPLAKTVTVPAGWRIVNVPKASVRSK